MGNPRYLLRQIATITPKRLHISEQFNLQQIKKCNNSFRRGFATISLAPKAKPGSTPATLAGVLPAGRHAPARKAATPVGLPLSNEPRCINS